MAMAQLGRHLLLQVYVGGTISVVAVINNGIFVLGVGFCFFRQISTFYLTIFEGIFLYHSKTIIVLSLSLKIYFTCDHLSESYEGLKIAILANLGQ